MKLRKNLLVIIFISILSTIIGCAGHQRIKFDETYLKIKPAAPLPEFAARKQPMNLYIEINNVADLHSSYKNRLTLFVNNFLVEPEEQISNIKSTYAYPLSLLPGIYNVKAHYYASTGWKEETFKILPHEPIMIFPDKKAILKVVMTKDGWGAPVDKITYFSVSYEPIEPPDNK